MLNAADLIKQLTRVGVSLDVEGDKLRASARKEVITFRLAVQIRDNELDILSLLPGE